MADNASRYRSAYAQRHAERLAEDMARAEAELKAAYEDSEAAQAAWQKRLDEELKLEREYLLELQKLTPRPSGKKGADGEDGGGGSNLDAFKTLAQVAVAKSNAASDDATRRVNLIKIHDDSWTAPPTVVRTLNEDVQAIRADLTGVTDPVIVSKYVKARLANEHLAPAMAALETPEQRQDAAIKYGQALGAVVRLSPDTVDQVVSDAFGLSLRDVNSRIFTATKEKAKAEIEKKAYAGGTKDLDYLSRELKEEIEGRGGSTLAKEAAQEATSKAQAYLSDPRWMVVRAALDDGVLTLGEAVLNPVTGEGDIIVPQDILDYQSAAREIGAGASGVSPLDAPYFDPLFLERIGKESAVTKRIADIEAKRAAGYPGAIVEAPTAEAIRRRAAEINAPHRYMTPGERRSEGAKARDLQAEVGKEAADVKAGVPSTMTDQQRATLAASRAAIQLVRGSPEWEKEESDAQAKARQVRGLVDAGLGKSEAYKKIAELAGDDKELRDDIYSRVLAYDVSKKERERVEPTPLPGVTGEPILTPAELEKKRRELAIEELSRIGAEGI